MESSPNRNWNPIEVIRECQECGALVKDEINKEAWGSRAYGEAARLFGEPAFCEQHRWSVPVYCEE